MLNINNQATAKKSARVLERFMEALGHPLKLGNALDAIGAMAGHTNWATLSRVFSVESVDAGLHDFERAHIRGTTGDCYSSEAQLTAPSGFQLRFGLVDGQVDYVRVCDPLGREISYWTNQEWIEDPAVVVSAFLVSAGRALAMSSSQVVKAKGVVRPSDVPYSSLSAMSIDDSTYQIGWVDYDVIAKLSSISVFEDDLDVVAMTGSYEDDGRTVEVELTLGQLRTMTWSPSQRAFVTECGLVVVFHLVSAFNPDA